MVLDEADNVVLASGFDEEVVVGKKLSGRLGDKDVNTAFDRVEADGVMGT